MEGAAKGIKGRKTWYQLVGNLCSKSGKTWCWFVGDLCHFGGYKSESQEEMCLFSTVL